MDDTDYIREMFDRAKENAEKMREEEEAFEEKRANADKSVDWTSFMPKNSQKDAIDALVEKSKDAPWGEMTREQAERILRDAQAGVNGSTDKRICVCGHAAVGHTDFAPSTSATHNSLRDTGTKACTPGRGYCECDNFREVLTCSDTRLFRHTTRSSNEGHALRLGVTSADAKGKTVEWSKDIRCYFCPEGAERSPLVPIVMDRFGREVNRATKYNAMTCATHRKEIAEAAARGEVDFGA